jgi:tetratricopeptide (TPR) repeat protein
MGVRGSLGRSFVLAALLVGLWAAARGQAPPAGKDKKAAGKGTDFEQVERLLAARREYQVVLEGLRAHYIAAGDIERARWAEEELVQFHRIPKHAFRLELDVPPPTLQANYNIPEANDLYRRAMLFKDKGVWSSDYLDNQRRAELLFQQMLTNYPQSDKISDAAYQLGDIYESKSYRQYDRAAAYFERCFQWNPKTQFDARLRAARLYDRYLNERNRAIEIYKEITVRETDARRMEEAQKRLTELGQKK